MSAAALADRSPIVAPPEACRGGLAELAGYGASLTTPGTVVYATGRINLRRPPAPWSVEVTGGDERRPWRWECTADTHRVIVVDVNAPGAQVAGPWAGLEPAQLRAALRRFEELVEAPWILGTGITVEKLILATHPPRRGGLRLRDIPPPPEIAGGAALEQPHNWIRPLTPRELETRWVHTFDQNAQYLGAWGNVLIGTGDWAFEPGPIPFDARRVGLWHVASVEGILPALTLLPSPAWFDGQEWFSSATLARIVEMRDAAGGFGPIVCDQAYVWEGRARYLSAAATRLGRARAALTAELDDMPEVAAGARAIASSTLDAVKGCYRVGTGRFAWGGRVGHPFHRPDWGHHVRAIARVNLHRRLARLTSAPFAIATDAVAFATDHATPREFAELAGLPLGGKLGEFTYTGSCPLEQVVDLHRPAQVFAAVVAAREAADA